MKERVSQRENVSRTLSTNPKSFNQASLEVVLQQYSQKYAIQKKSVHDEEDLLQGKFKTAQREELIEQDKEPLPIQQKSENKTGLPDNLKSGIENLSGYSLDDVKVHYSSDKPAQLSALAYAQGTDIHVAPGQERHLPHEAWHVVQQKQGRVQPTMQMQGVDVNDNEGLEREADVMGKYGMNQGRRKSDSVNGNDRPSVFVGFRKQQIQMAKTMNVNTAAYLSLLHSICYNELWEISRLKNSEVQLSLSGKILTIGYNMESTETRVNQSPDSARFPSLKERIQTVPNPPVMIDEIKIVPKNIRSGDGTLHAEMGLILSSLLKIIDKISNEEEPQKITLDIKGGKCQCSLCSQFINRCDNSPINQYLEIRTDPGESSAKMRQSPKDWLNPVKAATIINANILGGVLAKAQKHIGSWGAQAVPFINELITICSDPDIHKV